MTPIEIFLLPGRYVLEFIFHIHLREIEPALIAVFSGMLSWVIWMALIRAAWAITLKLFGFAPRGRG